MDEVTYSRLHSGVHGSDEPPTKLPNYVQCQKHFLCIKFVVPHAHYFSKNFAHSTSMHVHVHVHVYNLVVEIIVKEYCTSSKNLA